MWLPRCWDEGGGCSRAVPRAEGCQEGEKASPQAQKQHGEARRSTGRQSQSQPREQIRAHPWALQSSMVGRGVRSPLGPAQGRPVSQWRCFPRQGLSAHCPAAWIQSLRIINAANNSQQAPGPQACAPQLKDTACARRMHHSWTSEPPHYSLPSTGARNGPGRKPPTPRIQAPRVATTSHLSWARALSTGAGSPFYF